MTAAPGRRTLLVVMDPIARIKPAKDTTLALLLAAQAEGWSLHYAELNDLSVRDGVPKVSARGLAVCDNDENWYRLESAIEVALADYPLILMRKDPPFDLEYVYATYWLELAERAGSRVVNRPNALRDCNEKGFITHFPQCTTPTLIARDASRLRAFHAEHEDIILKPMDGMGGAGVFRIGRDGMNLGSVIETLTDNGRRTIMAQRYLPAIREGDKRILMIDGIAVDHALARIPTGNETRGNLAAGGRGEVKALSDRDRWIAAEVGPELKRRGLLFVGLDVIGDSLTEINVTSPTCLREITRATGQDIAGRAIRAFAEGL
jgi:glutathione synthase